MKKVLLRNKCLKSSERWHEQSRKLAMSRLSIWSLTRSLSEALHLCSLALRHNRDGRFVQPTETMRVVDFLEPMETLYPKVSRRASIMNVKQVPSCCLWFPPLRPIPEATRSREMNTIVS